MFFSGLVYHPGCDVNSGGHPDVEGDEESEEQSVKWIRLEGNHDGHTD